MNDDDATPLTFGQVATRLGRLHPSTVRRWVVHGLDGLHLPAKRIGGRWYVTWPAVQEFLRAVENRKRLAVPSAPNPLRLSDRRTPEQRQRAAERSAQRTEAIFRRLAQERRRRRA